MEQKNKFKKKLKNNSHYLTITINCCIMYLQREKKEPSEKD